MTPDSGCGSLPRLPIRGRRRYLDDGWRFRNRSLRMLPQVSQNPNVSINGSTTGPASGRKSHWRSFREADWRCANVAMPSGTTCRAQGSRSVRVKTVHPRVCGEQSPVPARFGSGPGSSPRVRGTDLQEHSLARSCRFIPACAGNSPRSPGRSGWGAVHPRVCGEQHGQRARCGVDRGSSPRVRGTGAAIVGAQSLERFIPACAGNSLQGRRLWMRCRGSSPRVRGTGPMISCLVGSRSVHPRVCGEQGGPAQLADGSGGSSPRVRGTVRPCAARQVHRRFIPACAGNRSSL